MGDDDSAESHFEDTFAAGHHAARPELVRRLAEGGPDAIAWLESLGVAFSRDDGRLRLLRCGGATPQAPAAGRRAHRRRDGARAPGGRAHERRRGVGGHPPRGPGPGGRRLARRRWLPAATEPGARVHADAVVLAAGGGLRGEADALGVGSTNHPDATPEVLRLALELGAEGRELDSWQSHPTGSVWPEALAGYALPETTRGLRRHPARRRRRALRGRARPPRRGGAGRSWTRCDAGRGVAAPDGQLGVWLDTPAIDRENGAGLHRRAARLRPQPLPQGGRGHHPRARAGLPRAPLPQRRPRDRRRAPRPRCPACSRPARSPAASTAPTG